MKDKKLKRFTQNKLLHGNLSLTITELYYHKLLNFRKRIEKMDIPEEYKKEYLVVCEKQMEREKERSKQAKREYQDQEVRCEVCQGLFLRRSLYTHKKTHQKKAE